MVIEEEVYRMIERGILMSEICKRLKISLGMYWELKRKWEEQKRREFDARREFYRLRVKVHERCKQLLIRLYSEEVAQRCISKAVRDLERIQKRLPFADVGELKADIGLLQEIEQEIERAERMARVEKRMNERRKFRLELKKLEARRLRALYRYAARHGLSLEERLKRAKRIRELYGDIEQDQKRLLLSLSLFIFSFSLFNSFACSFSFFIFHA